MNTQDAVHQTTSSLDSFACPSSCQQFPGGQVFNNHMIQVDTFNVDTGEAVLKDRNTNMLLPKSNSADPNRAMPAAPRTL